MNIEQAKWTRATGWMPQRESKLKDAADLVLVFGDTPIIDDVVLTRGIQDVYSRALIVGCSTAGEILGAHVLDESLTTTAIRFERTRVKPAHVRMRDHATSAEAGEALAAALPPTGLRHVIIFSDGHSVNGSELLAGMQRALPARVQVTGGLAGDGARFQRTLVWGEAGPEPGVITAVGFYGDHFHVGYGSLGGWDPFGPERVVTSSKGNVLATLDDQPALALYKRYIGEHADKLPSAGLLFPLSIRTRDGHTFVRTILDVDEKKHTMTFAGDVPEGSYARLMKANFDRLVEGAHGAAILTKEGAPSPELALLISCVGRKLVLGQRTEEEVEAVREVLGHDAYLTGFYSYGEICPAAPGASCELHNQTMTITTFRET